MWRASILFTKESANTMNFVISRQQYSINFCENGISFLAGTVAIFFPKSDIFGYTIQHPISFSVVSNTKNFAIGPLGTRLSITCEAGNYFMQTAQLSNVRTELSELIQIDALLTAGQHVISLPSDRLYRSIMCVNNGSVVEYPIILPPKIPTDGIVTVEVIAKSNEISIAFGGVCVSLLKPSNINTNTIINIAIKTFHDFVKITGAQNAVLGYVPSSGAFENIWYVRSVGSGRSLWLINVV